MLDDESYDIPTRKKYTKPRIRKMSKLGYDHCRGSKLPKPNVWGAWHGQGWDIVRKADSEYRQLQYDKKEVSERETVENLIKKLTDHYYNMPRQKRIIQLDNAGTLSEYLTARLEEFSNYIRNYEKRGY